MEQNVQNFQHQDSKMMLENEQLQRKISLLQAEIQQLKAMNAGPQSAFGPVVPEGYDAATQCSGQECSSSGGKGHAGQVEKQDAATQCSDKGIRIAMSSVAESARCQDDYMAFWRRDSQQDGSDGWLPRLLIRMLKLVAWVSRIVFVSTPDVFGRVVPHANSILSMGILYVFFQTMALLFAFMVVAGSIMSTSAVQYVDECDVTSTGVFTGWNRCLTPSSIVYAVVRMYMHFAVLRICYYLGRLLFEIGWEMYGDFPHLRLVLNPRHYTGGLGASSLSPEAKSRARDTVRRVQQTTLLAPLVVLACASALLTLAPLLPLAGSESGSESSASFFARSLLALQDNASRLNRTMRLTVCLGLMQWNQHFISLFPRWYAALLQLPGTFPLVLFLSALGPPSCVRLLEWFFYTSGRSNVSQLLGGTSHHHIDNVLFLGWSLLFLASALVLLHHPRAVRLAGWRQEPFVDAGAWCRLSFRFKFLVMVPNTLHFFRGLLSPTKGFTFAQNDVLFSSIAFPLALALIWAVAYCSMILRPWHVIFAPLITAASVLLCRHVAHEQGVGVLAAVWLHLLRQVLKRWEPVSLVASFPYDPRDLVSRSRVQVGPRRAFGYGRKLAVRVAKVFIAAAIAFVCSMACLGVLAVLQKDSKWFPTASFRSLSSPEAGGRVRIRHAISQLDLSNGPPPSGLPEYAVCQARLWGLGAVDYALLSLAAYFEPDEIPGLLPSVFPSHLPHVATPLHVPYLPAGNASEREREGGQGDTVFWAEFEFPRKQLTVVAVRGTEFWRLSDYLEDVRMWTEPVTFSLLSIVLPSIGAWSPHARAMVTDTLHALLDAVGLPDLEYKYLRLKRHIQLEVMPRLKPGHELVLTGHSLGGGMAHIVGALLNLPVVSFSPPGSYQSLSKHLYWNAREKRQMHHTAHNRTVSFLVENDMIGRLFDTHGGLVQTLTCTIDFLGPLGCHMLESTICNLIQHCQNDPRWSTCEFSYHAEPVVEGMRQHIVESYRKGELVILAMVAALVASGFAAIQGATYILEKL